MDKQQVFDKVMELANGIKERQELMHKNNDDLEEMESLIKDRTFEMTAEIAEKEGPDGKKLYSNETKRQVAFKEMCEKDADFNTMKLNIKELRKTNLKLSLETELMRNTIRAYDISSRCM